MTALRDILKQARQGQQEQQQRPALQDVLSSNRAIPGTPAATGALEKLDVSAAPTTVSAPTQQDVDSMPQLLTALESALDTPTISSALADVLRHINDFPETAELLRPEEVGKIVQACAQSFNVVVEQKKTRKTKRQVKSEAVQEDAAFLAEIGL